MSAETAEAAWPTGTMGALAFTGPSQLEWTVAPIPAPEPGTVLVRVEALGICGTDVHLYDGSSAYIVGGATVYPFRPGHEYSGRVVAVGEGVVGLEVGDRVVGEPFLPCHRCAVCRAGNINLCPNRAEQGVRANVDGAAAEYVRQPQANVAKVPQSVPAEHALIAEPSVTVLNSLATAGLAAGMRVAVIGSGTLGLIATQVAACSGATVHTIGIDDGLALALEAGASTISSPDEAPSDAFDVVVEASGARSALATALRVAAPGGHIAQSGIPGGESSGVVLAEMVAKGLTVSGILGGVPFLRRAVQLISDGVIDPSLLIGSVRPWDEVDTALNDMIAGGLTRPKIVIDLRELSVEAVESHRATTTE